MFTPVYHLSSKVISLVSEISEQVGILETLTNMPKENPKEAFDPFSEDDFFRAHQQLVDGLSEGIGHYCQDDQRTRLHMSMLFDWLIHTDEHPIVSSCIFHYNINTIRPFSEGNERLGLYWQTLLLVRWRPVLAGLPFERVVVEHQEEYRRVMAYLSETAKTGHFIEFILGCLLDTVMQEVKNKSRGKVQDKSPKNAENEGNETHLSKSEQRIVKLLADDPRITIGTISHRLQLSEAGVNKALAGLRKKGIIERVGANKNGSWKVNI